MDDALASNNLADHLDLEEDSDDWLNVDAEQFERMLEDAQRHPKAKAADKDSNAMDVDTNSQVSEEDRVASQQAKQLKELASKVEGFIQGQGELEGALFEE